MTYSANKERYDREIYNRSGNSGLLLPQVSLGLWHNFGHVDDFETGRETVLTAFDHGIIHFDLANNYGPPPGSAEENFGKILRNDLHPYRDELIISTKAGYRMWDGPYGEWGSRKYLLASLDQSLRRMGLEYVDILYLHAISTREATLSKPVLEVMQKLKKEGRTRYLGVSTHSHEPDVIQAAIDRGVYDVVLVAYNFQQSHREDMDKAIERAAQAGLGVIAMKTMAGGRMNKDKKHPVKAGTALKWALQNPNVTTSIPGFTTFDQLEEDLAVARDITLSEEEKNELALATRDTLYCDGCARCVAQCKKSLPIPDLMRAYMYTYGYRETRKARDLIDELAITTDACATCDECTVTCVKDFAVAEKITDIIRLSEVPQEFLT